METDATVFQQPLTKNILNLLIILCYYVFVTRKSDMYKCCTPLPMDFIKHKALMFIRGSGFIDLSGWFGSEEDSPSAVGM